ncbi:MAG: glutathione S-transferase [Pseudomonadota bacterium]|nr:glutathione S-transferase [Pseudomonadota bacterium]
MLKILGKSSSINVRKVLWTCAEMDLAYEHEQWGSGFRSTQAPEFLALNPNALVPVLQDGAVVLWESNTICRYLASRQGRHDLLPERTQDRARIEQWMDWQATELNNAWRYAFRARIRGHSMRVDPEPLAASIAEWNRHMQMLDAQLAQTGAYVAGDTFTLADVGLGLATNRWLMTPIERPHLPAVQAYFERLSQRPAFLLHGRNGTP